MSLERGKEIPGTVSPSTLCTSLCAARGAPPGAANDTADGSTHAVRRGVRMSARAKRYCVQHKNKLEQLHQYTLFKILQAVPLYFGAHCSLVPTRCRASASSIERPTRGGGGICDILCGRITPFCWHHMIRRIYGMILMMATLKSNGHRLE